MNNFAVLDITYLHFTLYILISNTTNNPCHLTCYYTDKTPLRHKTSRTERGLTLPWGAYFCFVAWLSVEQVEAGDTLTHTFRIPDWSYCQTKWFAFRGTVAEVLSPSVSPIFAHHHPGVIPINIGSPPIDRAFGTTSENFYILKENPSNVRGTITQLQIYLVNPCLGLRVFTAYEVSPNTFTTRDSAYIGVIDAGYHEIPVSISAHVGDYIGWAEVPFNATWRFEADIFGAGYWYATAEDIPFPFTNYPFIFAPNRTNSLHGTG